MGQTIHDEVVVLILSFLIAVIKLRRPWAVKL